MTRDTLNSDEFCNQPPAEVYQRLLERGIHLCSVSTMHRILRAHGETGERRDQRTARHHALPRLLAEAPNQVWTWDCSKLATRARGVYLTLYVVLDLFGRFVLAWMVSRKENSTLARQLMSEAALRYRIDPGQLTIHQDRGAPMIAHRYIDQMTELGIVLSHSRPRVSNDNPFSEAQFKTQKHQPDYPGRFENAAHARAWCGEYFDWYNFTHHHSGLAGLTPEQVFTGRYRQIAAEKQQALDARYQQTPERFTAGRPSVALPPSRVRINPITPEEVQAGATDTVNFPTLNRVLRAQEKNEAHPGDEEVAHADAATQRR
jgi:putative transposase